MLQEDIKTPVLYFAMDQLSTPSVDTFGALSVENSEVLQSEIAKKKAFKDKADLTDIYEYLSRVAIPINDKLLPIHYAGGTASQSHFVDYLDSNAVMTKAGNIVVLRFELKNSLSALSTTADLILGIATKDFFVSNEPRISFFSANLCIFNAYLRGISRSIVNDTDKEMLSITLEIAPTRIPVPVETDKPILNNSLENPLTEAPPATQNTGDFAQITADEIDYQYNWYELFTTEEIDSIEVPDFQPDYTIERENIRFMRVNSVDFNNAPRLMITIEFKEVYTTLKAEDGQKLNENYGLMMYENNLYFGIINAN